MGFAGLRKMDMNKSVNLNYLFEELKAECDFISTKYDPMFNSFHEAYGVIKEELDEFWECVKDNKTEGMKEELIQIAATALCSAYLCDTGSNNPKFKWPKKDD